MRCSTIFMMLFIFTTQGKAKDFTDKFIDKFIDKLFDRALKVLSPHRIELENTTLVKGSLPQGSSATRIVSSWMPRKPMSPPTSALMPSPSYGTGVASHWHFGQHVCRASSTRAPQFDAQRTEEFVKLGQELFETAVRSGPNAAIRTAQALEAALSIGSDVAAEVSSRAAANPAAVGDVNTVSNLLPTAPNVLRRFCEKLGATYIKLGQFVASAPTIFPKDFVEEFQKCLDQAPPVPFAEVRKIVESETGKPLSQTFSEFDEVPVASASVAVVHRARLRENRREVAVKVLRPGIGVTLGVDLDFIKSAARILQFVQPELKRLSIADIAADIQTSMLEEVDLRKELANLKAFRAYLEVSGAAGVTAPLPFDQYCSEKVMVTEFLRGVPLTDLEAIRKITTSPRAGGTTTEIAARDPEEVLINALNAWLGSVFLAESFHADVHAGNLLALPSGDVAFIDFGIVGRIKQTTWGALRGLFGSFGANAATADPTRPSTAIDYDAMAVALVEIGATDSTVAARVDVQSFAADLKELFDSIFDLEPSLTVVRDPVLGDAAAASATVDEAALNRAVGNLQAVGDRYGLKFPREFGLLVKQALYFDRYTKILAPTLEVGADPRIQKVPDEAPRVEPGVVVDIPQTDDMST